MNVAAGVRRYEKQIPLFLLIPALTILWGSLALAAVLWLNRSVGRHIVRPVQALAEDSRRIAENDYSGPPVSTECEDEIADLVRAFCRMKLSTQGYIEALKEKHEAEKQLEAVRLQMLKNQINPHFLYNCLSSIKWKAIRTGNDEISDLTGHLAKFYRTSLNGGKQITTVGSELENVKSYVELQRMTHENSFDVEYELDETLFETSMPNFLLQPIVENAIEHGMNYQEEIEGRGRLIVRLEEEDGHLIFSILNNGPRVELDRLEEILNTPGRGYGIYNIEERIRIYYGAGCGVYASVTADGYTCFTVRIGKELKELSV